MPDVVIKSDRKSMPGTSGDDSYTITDAGTPKVVLAVPSFATANATFKPHAHLGLGMSHGPSAGHGFGMQGYSEDAVATSNTARQFDTNDIMTGQIGYGFAADWKAWITDGVTLNYRSTVPTSLFGLILMGGADLQVDTHILANLSTSKTGLAFEPDVLIIASGNTATPSIGFAVNPDINPASASIEQCSMNWHSMSSAANADPQMWVSDDKVCSQVYAGSLNWSSSITAFNSDGYSITGMGDAHFVCALNLGGLKAWCGVVDAKSGSTGTKAYTGVGFQPSFLMQLLNHITAVNTVKTDATGGAAGVRVYDGSNEHSYAYLDEDAAATMNTASYSDTKGNLPQDDQSTGMTMNVDSLDSDGWTDDFTAVHNAAKLPTLCIGEEVASTSNNLLLLGVS